MMAGRVPGVSVFKREDETLNEYFLSFSPLAPFFGVPWRFGSMLPFMPVAPVAKPVADAAPEAARQVMDEPKAASDRNRAKADEAVERVGDATRETVKAVTGAAGDAAEAMADRTQPAIPDPMAEPDALDEDKPTLLYASAPDEADDLTRIKGVGPKLAQELNDLGIHTWAQVASLTEANLAWLDANLSTATFKGRSVRDDWVGQASALAEN